MPFSRKNVQVEVPKNSGFSLKHRNSGSLTCGTITPLLVEEVIPNTRVSCKLNLVHQLPPLASDTFMNVKVKVEAFFVPFRLLSRSFEAFFCDFPQRVALFSSSSTEGSGASFFDLTGRMPVFHFADDVPSSVWSAGTLLDYVGCIIDSIQYQGGFDFNPAALEAYHLIWQEWYRNPKVQNPAFVEDIGGSQNIVPADRTRIMSMPFKFYRDGFGAQVSNAVISFDSTNLANANLADGVSIFSLRQRNFGFDYFTSARPSAQQGAAAVIVSPVSGGNASTTIAAIREQNSIQQFRERNNITSPRMVDQVKARYNANLADGVAQRPICIGSATYEVVTRGVDQTADGTASSGLQNPFNTVANQYGRAYGAGSDYIISDFVANEPGLIFINQTLVPVATYSSGIRPYLRRYVASGSIVEMANPILQNVGDEPIDASCLDGDVGNVGTIFGFQDRYGSFMYHPSEVHGMLRDGQSLSSFVLQRSFGSSPVISTQFLEIPKNYLDGVFAVSSGVSGLSAWYDSIIELNLSMPLNEFSIPSLQDPAYEHGQSVNLNRNGQIF